MGNKQRIFTLMAILTAVTFISFGVSNYILYRRAIRMQRDRLIDVVQNQAQWFEQLLRFNLQSGGANQANVLRSTKAHIQELQFRGLGRTGEILFADREGDSIVFLSNRRFVKTGQSLSLSLSIRSSLSQPMRLALSGQSGTVIGPDYRGAKVLAAYEYIPLFGIGVVAKMDFSEIRAPFVDSTVVSGLLASLAIAIGLLLFYRVSNPMVTAVEQSEKKYRSLMDSLQEGVWAIDKNVDTTFVNPRMAGMLGYSIDEMLGKPLFEFMDEEGARAAKAKLKRRQQGVSEQHDFTFLKKDGSRIYTTLATSPLLDEQGRYAGALAGVMDLTERRRMEDALRGSEEKFRSVVEQSSDGIVLTDTNGLIIEWNPAAERILGPKRSDAINRPLWDVQYLLAPESKRTPETKEKLQSMLKAFYRDRKAPWIDRISENEIQMPDGRLRIIQSIVFPIQTGSGFMVGSIIRDVTETKKNESDLKFLLQEKDLLLK
ncbi:MAG TPA: PAS domain-containing protein, partial [bacterium]